MNDPEQMELFLELELPASVPYRVWELRAFLPFDLGFHLQIWAEHLRSTRLGTQRSLALDKPVSSTSSLSNSKGREVGL
jgi:hypothetical protein